MSEKNFNELRELILANLQRLEAQQAEIAKEYRALQREFDMMKGKAIMFGSVAGVLAGVLVKYVLK